MKRVFVIFAVSVLTIFYAETGFARIPVPGRTETPINDYAGILDQNAENYLKKLISSVKQETPDRAEMIVATFRSLDGWQFENFVLAYGEKWREIKKGRRDNGVILLIALQEGRMTIGVGQNLKGILTDPIIKDIIQNKIAPEFNMGNYAEGIKKGTEAIVEILNAAEIPQGPLFLTPKNIVTAFLIILTFFLIRRIVKKHPQNSL
ncbi:MAG: TPM domain-containing protein [Candidatus Omnitrophota bacterium]